MKPPSHWHPTKIAEPERTAFCSTFEMRRPLITFVLMTVRLPGSGVTASRLVTSTSGCLMTVSVGGLKAALPYGDAYILRTSLRRLFAEDPPRMILAHLICETSRR
jgi:hypothetical protein